MDEIDLPAHREGTAWPHLPPNRTGGFPIRSPPGPARRHQEVPARLGHHKARTRGPVAPRPQGDSFVLTARPTPKLSVDRISLRCPARPERKRRSLLTRLHQPGQAVFRAILPEDIEWKPFPAFPPSVRLAVIVGEPSKPGPYLIRVKAPSGVKLMPHRHPEDRIYTVVSGVFYIGLGDRFDGDKVKAYPPGSVIILPGDTPHFHWAKSGEYVTQVTAIGPLGLEYMDPDDDPRQQNR